MFGMGGSEIIVILIVALLFLGPDKLPEAAKQISQAVRGIRKQTRELQSTIENDTQIGGAIRDIKSALRGDEPRARPPVRKEPPAVAPASDAGALPAAGTAAVASAAAETVPLGPPAASTLRMPPRAGEADPASDEPAGDDDATAPADRGGVDLSALIRPAAGTVAKGAADDADQDDKAS